MKIIFRAEPETRRIMFIKRNIFSLIIILLLSGCSANSKSNTENNLDPKVVEICSLISETWQTYKNENLTDPGISDILQAGWYLAAEDMKELASQDTRYQVYVDGLNDASKGYYESDKFNAVRQLCGLE